MARIRKVRSPLPPPVSGEPLVPPKTDLLLMIDLSTGQVEVRFGESSLCCNLQHLSQFQFISFPLQRQEGAVGLRLEFIHHRLVPT